MSATDSSPTPATTTKRDLEQIPQESMLENLSFIRKEMTDAMKDISEIADRSASTLLLSLGAVILLFSFLFKLRIFGARFSDLSAGEFIAAMLISMVLLLVGALIRLYQFKKEQEAGKRIRESGVELLSKSLDISAGMATHEGSSSRGSRTI
jgi:hypothetical protein